MRKNIIRKWTVVVLSSMFVVALSGCGTSANATDITADDSKGLEIETEVNTDDVSDETMSTEVIGDDTEEVKNEVLGTEYDHIFIYSDAQETGYEPDLDACMPFNDKVVEYTFTSDIPVYYTSGWIAGYVKAGSTITFDNGSSEWLRFVPNVDGLTVPYLMVRNDEVAEHTNDAIVEVEGAYKMSPEDVKEYILEYILMRADKDDVTFLSTPDSDMETIEFTIWKQYREEGVRSAVSEALLDRNETVMYLTYYVECTGDEEKMDCTIYYKDMVEIEEQ